MPRNSTLAEFPSPGTSPGYTLQPGRALDSEPRPNPPQEAGGLQPQRPQGNPPQSPFVRMVRPLRARWKRHTRGRHLVIRMRSRTRQIVEGALRTSSQLTHLGLDPFHMQVQREPTVTTLTGVSISSAGKLSVGMTLVCI